MLTPQQKEICQQQIDACTDQIKIFNDSLQGESKNRSHSEQHYKDEIVKLTDRKATLTSKLNDPNAVWDESTSSISVEQYQALVDSIEDLDKRVTSLEKVNPAPPAV